MNAENTSAWAHGMIEEAAQTAAAALRKFCRKPQSAKRLHKARKCLARLMAGLNDLAGAAGTDPNLVERVHDVHRRAGKVRDADVLLARVKAYRDLADDGERQQLKTVARKLRKRRKKAKRRLQDLIDALPSLRP